MKVLGALLALVLLVGGVWFARRGDVSAGASAPTDETSFRLERGDLEILVGENGYLKAKHSVELKPTFRGEGLITWVIEEGTAVEEDDILVEFEKKEQQNSIDELKNAIVQVESSLESGRATLEIERRDAEASIEKAELAHRVAGMELERYRDGDAPNKRRTLELDTEKTLSALERSRERFAGVPELEAEGFLTKAQVEEERIRVREAEIAHEAAQKELQLFDEYSYRIELLQKEAALKDAERALANAREKAEITIREKEAQVTRLEGQLSTQRTRLDKLETDLANMTMRAPQAGIVHYGDPGNSWSRERVKIGNRVYRGNTVITLPDLSEMEARLKIHEADIDRVEEGQAARITLDTYPGHVFTGTVSHIAAVATSSGWDENTKTFSVTVDIDPSEVELRAGISAKLEILVDRLEDVLSVPLHAVHLEKGEPFAFVWDGASARNQAVELGLHNDHYVQILSGLEAGDQVLLYDPRDTNEGPVDDKPKDGAASALDGMGDSEGSGGPSE